MRGVTLANAERERATSASSAELSTLHRRTLRFAVSVLAQLEHPEFRLVGGDALGHGYFYELEGKELKAPDVEDLHAKLEEFVGSGEAILPVTKPWEDAVSYCEKHGLTSARAILQSRVSRAVDMYECRGVLRLALYPLHASVGALAEGRYKILPCDTGFVAAFAEGEYVPQPALKGAFSDHVAFGKSLGVSSVGALNTLKQVNRERMDFALACEGRQDRKIAEIALLVRQRFQAGTPVKVICIGGPSSSGKTTFANKLCLHLKGEGLNALPLGMDNYYYSLDKQPGYQLRQQITDVDYESPESIEMDLLAEHLKDLVAGKSVTTPIYDMKTDYRKETGQPFEGLKQNEILIIEGIHALNPLFTKSVEDSKVFRVFISPLTALQLDDANKVKTTDHRLLRRMCRDYLFRSNTASRTLNMWEEVRKGENLYIFPHQNSADFVMNSAAEYEICVLKTFAEPLLREVTPDDASYAKASEILQLLDRFAAWPTEVAPATALLREFIGGGAFDCH